MIDVPRWLASLDGENPSGESLRNEPRFHELERLVEPKFEVVRDDRNNPSAQIAVPTDWQAVLGIADELRQKGRDLRLLVLVTRALANEDGLAGLAQGLTLIARTFDEHWDTMHPELRPGGTPQQAALRRTNALQQLQNDQEGLLADLRQMTFFAPRGVGAITGRDLERGTLDERTILSEAASGLSDSEKASLVSAHEQLVGRVRTGCVAHADQSGAEMTALQADARAAIAALEEVETALAARLGEARAAAPELKRFLERLAATLSRAAANPQTTNGSAGDAAMSPSTPEPASANGHAAETARPAATGNGAVLPDRIHSRDDVVKCLDLVVSFYDRTEPSSPIPHLARRIRRMVPMDFVELMEDLAPSGLKEFRLLAGVPEGKKVSQKDER